MQVCLEERERPREHERPRGRERQYSESLGWRKEKHLSTGRNYMELHFWSIMRSHLRCVCEAPSVNPSAICVCVSASLRPHDGCSSECVLT